LICKHGWVILILCMGGRYWWHSQVGIIVAAASLAWMLLLPASLGPSCAPEFGAKMHGKRYLVPATLMLDLLLALLAFGAATAAAPDLEYKPGIAPYSRSRVAASVAMMFLASLALASSLVHLGFETFRQALEEQSHARHGQDVMQLQ